ncbi:MAG: tripartite tricarboxylate transporter substrate binding protein [Bradyrhizobiaceae bacterium]|nr:tripartite tricarboxylate transporter substrate binding protein [Bradyrhizobiaceae bacterium]
MMLIRAGAFLVGLCALTGAVSAQTYPSRNITLIIPFAAGGSNDIVGRTVGRKLAEAFGQPVLVENRPGAGGVIGAAAAAAAPPDGYTLLLVSSTFTINPAVKKSMPFDTVRDFTPVAFIARSPLLVTASEMLGVTSAKELFDLARSMPGKITYASSGPGSINQISAELIALSAGIKLLHVPYKGGAPALNDLLGGHVDIYVSSLPQVLSLARSGQAKALAVTSLKRTPLLPDVPTLDESGIHGFDSSSWWGIVGPAGMPAAVVAALNAQVGNVVTSPDVRKVLANEGADTENMTPQQFSDLMRAETQRWIRVAHEANISID